ncbi:hypothetical protein GFM29_02710 [Rhizobium leguminosarum bv. viciae]|nr:hypothetical protein [Rhizobium leguminosarum bv. viciae]
MRGGWGTERLRHIPFAPQAGRRCRQADEGPTTHRQRRFQTLPLRCDQAEEGALRVGGLDDPAAAGDFHRAVDDRAAA